MLDWKYCFEEMPKSNITVLLAYKNQRGLNIVRARYCESVKNWYRVDCASFTLVSFTPISFKPYAWTYLPDPPEYKEQ